MELKEPKITGKIEQAPVKLPPTPNNISAIFEHYAEDDRDPKYTLDEQRDLLTSVDFLRRIASSRLLATSFFSFDDENEHGMRTPPELTAAMLSDVIAGFIDEYAQDKNPEDKEGKSSELLLDFEYGRKDLVARMLKQLEGQNFRPAFQGGSHGETRIEVVAEKIVDTLKNELAFKDFRRKGQIYRWVAYKRDFSPVLHFALHDASNNLDQQKKAIFNRLFNGNTLRSEGFKRFLFDSHLSDDDLTSIFDSVDFIDANLTAASNMVKGFEQEPGFKEEIIAEVKNLVNTLVDAHSKAIDETAKTVNR